MTGAPGSLMPRGGVDAHAVAGGRPDVVEAAGQVDAVADREDVHDPAVGAPPGRVGRTAQRRVRAERAGRRRSGRGRQRRQHRRRTQGDHHRRSHPSPRLHPAVSFDRASFRGSAAVRLCAGSTHDPAGDDAIRADHQPGTRRPRSVITAGDPPSAGGDPAAQRRRTQPVPGNGPDADRGADDVYGSCWCSKGSREPLLGRQRASAYRTAPVLGWNPRHRTHGSSSEVPQGRHERFMRARRALRAQVPPPAQILDGELLNVPAADGGAVVGRGGFEPP